MLSDREQKTLREFERRFLVEDPDFARSFDVVERSPTQHSVRSRRTYTVWIVLTAVLSVLMLAAGSPGTALLLAAAACLVAVARRHRDDGRDWWATLRG